MSSDHQITEDARKWFWGMGVFALSLVAFLIFWDNTLSTSNREQVLGRTLHELRSAQAGLSARVTDPRLTVHGDASLVASESDQVAEPAAVEQTHGH